MVAIDSWMIILIIAVVVLAVYVIFYKMTQKKKLHSLTEEHKVSEPHNNLNMVKTFIENCWSKGYSIPEIKEILIEKGWNENTIDKVFHKSSVPNGEETTSRIKRKIKPQEQKEKPKEFKRTPETKQKKSLGIFNRALKKPESKIKPKPEATKKEETSKTKEIEVKEPKELPKLESASKEKTDKKGANTQADVDPEEKFGISDSGPIIQDDYKESDVVSNLKKKVLKDVKEEDKN